MGSAVSAIAATGLVAIVLRNDDEQRIQSEVVSAHLRSLQAGHLTDVLSTDQHTVKPWFNGRLDVAPPVIDLTAQGFTLIAAGSMMGWPRAGRGGLQAAQPRHQPVRRAGSETEHRANETVQGFNIRRWSERGLNYWAVSDLGADELTEFGEKFEAAMRVRDELVSRHAMRILHATSQSRDRTKRRRLSRPRISSAPLREELRAAQHPGHLRRLPDRVVDQRLAERPDRAGDLVAVGDDGVERALDPVAVLIRDGQRRQQLYGVASAARPGCPPAAPR